MFDFIRNSYQKLVAARAFMRVVGDPHRLDDVFGLSDGTNQKEILERAADRFAMIPKGERALEARRRLPQIDLQRLAKLPGDTLGYAFGHHMLSRGLDPASIPTLDSRDRGEFLRAHLYETHDIWHVVTGFDTDVAGELGLQGFYMAQVHGPLPPALLAAGFLNTAFYTAEETDERMRNIVTGWRTGKRAEPLFGTDWDLLWETPLAEVRRMHGLDPRGVQAELAEEARIMTGIGGQAVYEAARARIIADKAAKSGKAPMKQLAAPVSA
jgi:ubiquinone biosynthesis protein Coq4